MKTHKSSFKQIKTKFPKEDEVNEKKISQTKEEKEYKLLGRKFKRNDDNLQNKNSFQNTTDEDTEKSQINEPYEKRNSIYVKFYRKRNKKQLEQLFGKYGKIKKMLINIRHKRNFGIIEFYDSNSAYLVIKDKKRILESNLLYIDYVRGKKEISKEKKEKRKHKREENEKKEVEENNKEENAQNLEDEGIETVIEKENNDEDELDAGTTCLQFITSGLYNDIILC